jgi:hypothetical protein
MKWCTPWTLTCSKASQLRRNMAFKWF